MLFTTLIFIFIFLPAVLLAYYALPKSFRNYVLLLFSLVFYSWGGVGYTLILIFSIIINYTFVKRIEKGDKYKGKWLNAGLFFNLLIIFIFKYLDFFIMNFNGVGLAISSSWKNLAEANIILPLGISFFTFQQMSLLWDVYRAPSQKPIGFLNTALYVSFFPQLIAGPIVRYHDIIDQIRKRAETIEMLKSGIQRFILGLFKKVVIANSCAVIADSIMDNPAGEVTTAVAWLGIVSYAFQIYFDFSGYSDMAIGLSRMFGFNILENFNFPYISRSIKEFWSRWHISLSSWFRDYLYIPIGGNRKGPYNTYFNLLLVFVLTGFWHGATWSFIFWGVFHGTFLIIERLGLDKILRKLPQPISWSYTLLVVLIGWVFFRIESFSDSMAFVGVLFGYGGATEVDFIHYLDRERLLVFLIAILASTTTFSKVKDYIGRLGEGRLLLPYTLIKDLSIILVLLYCTMYINAGSYSPFIYFRF